MGGSEPQHMLSHGTKPESLRECFVHLFIYLHPIKEHINISNPPPIHFCKKLHMALL